MGNTSLIRETYDGLVAIKGGTFRMVSDKHYPESALPGR